MQQMTINFDRSLIDQFPDFMDCVRSAVYDCGKPFKNVAADLDYSKSELSRRISADGDLPAVLDDLPQILLSTGDTRPIYWLIEKFLVDDETKQKVAIDTLTKLMPQIDAVLKSLGKKR